jgi:hypothetical protein
LNVKKGDLFPVVEGPRGTHDGKIKLELESPILIDPTDADDVGLISFERDEEACVAVCATGVSGDVDKKRVEHSIEILGLNRLDRLNQKRAIYWDRCLREIAKYTAPTAAQSLRKVSQASARANLKQMVQYGAEFSSIVMACIRKHAPEPLATAVFDPGRKRISVTAKLGVNSAAKRRPANTAISGDSEFKA